MLRNASVSLGNLKEKRAVPLLIEALGTESALVRAHAAWALGEIGGSAAEQALEQAHVTETESQVQEEIVFALSRASATS